MDIILSVVQGGEKFETWQATLPVKVSSGHSYTMAYPWFFSGDNALGSSLIIEIAGDGGPEVCGELVAQISAASNKLVAQGTEF